MGSDAFFATMRRLDPIMLTGNLQACQDIAVETLLAQPKSPFHIAADLNFTNTPKQVAAYFDKFFAQASKQFEVKALYTEMNGFDINTKKWDCSAQAYDIDAGIEDFEWLCDPRSCYSQDLLLTGLEPLQAVYAIHYGNREYSDTTYICSVVVLTKFQRLIQRACAHMKKVRVPIYATAHDFDYIPRIMPGQP